MKKCLFCKSNLIKIKVNSFKILNSYGYFYNCSICKVDFNPKKYNEKIYTKKKY